MKPLFLALSLIAIFSFISVLSCADLKGADSAFPVCRQINDNYLVLGTAAIQLGLISIALLFIWEKDLKTTLDKLGFPGSFNQALIYSLISICAMFMVLFIVGVLAVEFHFDDQQKISDKLSGLPWYVLIFAVLAAPIAEELFFRALLSPRIGIIASAVLFGLSHVAYGSVVEMVGVFSIGLVLGAIYRMSKSVTPCILSHMAYNLLSLTAMLFLRQYA